METTLIFLKPDAVERGLQDAIFGRLSAQGLTVEVLGEVRATPEQITQHYEDLAKKHPVVFARNLPFFLSGPLMLALVHGEQAISRVRAMIGSTEKAAPGTIRGDLATDTIEKANAEGRGLHNLIHSSDSPESAQREMQIWARDRTVPSFDLA